MLDETLEETFPASEGRAGKPSFSMVSYGRLEKEIVTKGTEAAGNRMFGSSKRRGI